MFKISDVLSNFDPVLVIVVLYFHCPSFYIFGNDVMSMNLFGRVRLLGVLLYVLGKRKKMYKSIFLSSKLSIRVYRKQIAELICVKVNKRK